MMFCWRWVGGGASIVHMCVKHVALVEDAYGWCQRNVNHHESWLLVPAAVKLVSKAVCTLHMTRTVGCIPQAIQTLPGSVVKTC